MSIINFEFQVKQLGFANCNPEQFYKSQWGSNRLAFLIYRVLIFFYSLGYIVANLWWQNKFGIIQNYWWYLSNWSEVIGCLHFLLSLIVVFYGYVTRHKGQTQTELKWFHKLVWLIFTAIISASLVTDITYWGLLGRNAPVEIQQNHFNIHKHAINYVLLLIDLFVNDIPLRVLHFVYPVAFGLVYTVFSVIVWKTCGTVIYPFLNWGDNPGLAAFITMVASLVALPILHIAWHFWLYKLRSLIAKKCCSTEAENDSTSVDYVEMSKSEQKDCNACNA